jgi:hypothetical protein
MGAIMSDRPTLVKVLLARGADIYAKTTTGSTPLMQAAFTGDPDIINLLIAQGANLEDETPSGYTALMQAAYAGKVEALRALLAQGADIFARDNEGRTALMLAKNQREEVVDLLTNAENDNASPLTDAPPPATLTPLLLNRPAVDLVKDFHIDGGPRGSWQGIYGHDGYLIVNAPHGIKIPAYATITMNGNAARTFASPVTDWTALMWPEQKDASKRIKSTWYATKSFSFDVNLTDDKPHQIALYFQHWIGWGFDVTIHVKDVGTDEVLDKQTINTNSAGCYLVWTCRGHLQFVITTFSEHNAILNAIFFQ